MAITQLKEISNNNALTFLTNVFQKIENNYIRRTTYDAKIQELEGELDKLKLVLEYPFVVNPTTGHLSIVVPNDANPSFTVSSDGALTLSSNDTDVDNNIELYTFSVTSDGDLIATINT